LLTARAVTKKSAKAGPGGPAKLLQKSLARIDSGLAAFNACTVRDAEPTEEALSVLALKCADLANSLRTTKMPEATQSWRGQAAGFLDGAVAHMQLFVDNAPALMNDATQVRLYREHGHGFVHAQLVAIEEGRRDFAVASFAAASVMYGRAQGIARDGADEREKKGEKKGGGRRPSPKREAVLAAAAELGTTAEGRPPPAKVVAKLASSICGMSVAPGYAGRVMRGVPSRPDCDLSK
jgi:hypothetical protein